MIRIRMPCYSFSTELRTRFNSGEALDYLFFWGHRETVDTVTASCLSQWYPAAEHFMMVEKAALFGNVEARSKILAATDSAAARSLAHQPADNAACDRSALMFHHVLRTGVAFDLDLAGLAHLRLGGPIVLG